MTLPKEKGGVPPIEIHEIPSPEPKKVQDSKNEDDEFHRIERENKLKESS
jgi:hypothetical protein